MSAANDLLMAVKTAEASGTPDAVDAAREAYLELNPDGDMAATIRYRHGLSRLFRHKDTDSAMALFKKAAEEKGAAVSADARVSYALLLLSKQKRQQAIFELKKLAPDGGQPSAQAANALDFLTLALRESQAKADEIEKYDDMRCAHLASLAQSSDEKMEKAHWLLRLGAAWADRDGVAATQKARAAFNDVVKLGKAAGESAIDAAKASMRGLAR